MRELIRPPGEPRRPFDAPGGVEDLLVRLEELDPEVPDHRVPEPGHVLDGAPDELVIRADPMCAHEAGDVCPLEILGRRRPDDVAHAATIRRTTCVPTGPRRAQSADHPDPSIYMEAMGLRVGVAGVGWSGLPDDGGDLPQGADVRGRAERVRGRGRRPRSDIDSFVCCSEDIEEGTSIFDEYVRISSEPCNGRYRRSPPTACSGSPLR